MALTPETIMALPPGRHGDGNGLYLQVLPGGGGRSWLFRYQRGGRAHGMGLGPVDSGALAKSLEEARKAAAEARATLKAGGDPLAAKRARKAARTAGRVPTFAECAGAYAAAHRDSWKSEVHRKQWDQCMRDYILPTLRHLSVAEIGPQDVIRVLKPLWTKKPEVARKVCGQIGMVLNLAIGGGHRTSANPASLRIMRTQLGALSRERKHHAALHYKAVPRLVQKMEGRDDTATLALLFLIATATRSSEARGAMWPEVDLDAKEWRIPAARMKGGVAHHVPLSTFALDVLKRTKRRAGCLYVFPGRDGSAITETALRNLLRANGVDKNTGTLHGFRSSARDYMAEVLGTPDDVAECCLAHYNKANIDAIGSGASLATMRQYKRTTFYAARVEIMDKWGFFLAAN